MSTDLGESVTAPTGWLATPRGRAFRALAHPEFRMVWGTFVIGQLGFWIAFLALQTLMVDLTGGDGRWLGLLFFMNFIPMLVFTPLAGLMADRYQRRSIVVAGFAAITLIATALAVLAFMNLLGPAILLPFGFATGTVFAFTAPASQGLVVTTVPPADMSSAVSLQSVGGNLSRVIGPTIAAPILAFSSQDVAFVLYAVTSAIAMVLLARARISANKPEPESGTFFSRLKAGWDHAKGRPPALAALMMVAVSSLTAGAYLAILPQVADETFGRGSAGLATLAAISGVGSVAGAIATGTRSSSGSLGSVTLLVALFGLSFVAFGLAPTWPLALAASVAFGGFYFWAMTSINTLLQELCDDSKRGRVMALFVVGWAGLVPVGGLWQTAFAEAFTTRAAVVLAGAITAAYAGLTWVVATRRVPVAG